MSIDYSSIVRESVNKVESSIARKLISVFESRVQEHGSSSSLSQLFDTARDSASSDHDREVISWLESMIKSRESRDGPSTPPISPGQKDDDDDDNNRVKRITRSTHIRIEHHHHDSRDDQDSEDDDDDPEKPKSRVFVSPVFFPSEENFVNLIRTLDNAKKSLDICVFTITDDQITAAVARAHERGVSVRIITDDDKSDDQGSDVKRLAREYNIPARVDGSVSHMHHKFAVIDDALVISGSYNWTKGARFHNREDLTLTNSGKAVRAFKAQFEKLWDEFSEYEVCS
ncbi:hypothetical protein BX616_001629 [Lobosporangium transversale]|uniref:Mitochondrial cardiolipin hydrolase n=1 Tax=Lobosporangium transversale TaxID=64571 RepID=A0A1Y2GRZ2_9FUNG|nr:hypothetical protein BCR41DRAFT_350618 [Lobosporangium transversale]KAF9903455.1 hypothetical protein BX616_001629 [Lobosporangium transversale]ORZ20929.1 hypothetical protein BCR41DRAFT_350618 [Lobosporangium transversale]|eukprot:XP_021882838.1 hypothetical protein BCR41DRAFT_350618 [Lobosporangium transversale]